MPAMPSHVMQNLMEKFVGAELNDEAVVDAAVLDTATQSGMAGAAEEVQAVAARVVALEDLEEECDEEQGSDTGAADDDGMRQASQSEANAAVAEAQAEQRARAHEAKEVAKQAAFTELDIGSLVSAEMELNGALQWFNGHVVEKGIGEVKVKFTDGDSEWIQPEDWEWQPCHADADGTPWWEVCAVHIEQCNEAATQGAANATGAVQAQQTVGEPQVAQTRMVAQDAADAGGAQLPDIEACINQTPDVHAVTADQTAKEKATTRVPRVSLAASQWDGFDGAGVTGQYRHRPGTKLTLWGAIYSWMSGTCGLALYILAAITAKTLPLFERHLNWMKGADDRCLSLQPDGSFIRLPCGHRAHEMPDRSLLVLEQFQAQAAAVDDIYSDELALLCGLEAEVAADIRSRIPIALEKAALKIEKHFRTYQLLPWSAGRLIESTGPAFARAMLHHFMPDQRAVVEWVHGSFAELEGPLKKALDGSISDMTGEDIEFAAADLELLQRKHRKEEADFGLFLAYIEESVASFAIDEADRHCAKLKREREQRKKAEGLARCPSITPRERAEVEAIRREAKNSKLVDSFGLVEAMQGDAAFLKAMLRIAITGSTVFVQSELGLKCAWPALRWGEECQCKGKELGVDEEADLSIASCWCAARPVYEYIDRNFFPLVIHQMSVEGTFNILDHNQDNASVKRKESLLIHRMNRSCKTYQKLVEGISKDDIASAVARGNAAKKAKLEAKCANPGWLVPLPYAIHCQLALNPHPSSHYHQPALNPHPSSSIVVGPL